jgi:hypothetical protein
MRDRKPFLCSELVIISTGTKVTVGNLDSIGVERCTVTLPVPVPIGCCVSMRCLECPKGGRKACGDCRFRGQVRSSANDPVLGHLIHIDFEGRMWSPEEWEPGHLKNVRHLFGTEVSARSRLH